MMKIKNDFKTMYKDFKKCLKGKLHIIIISLLKIKKNKRAIEATEELYKNQQMAKTKSKNVLKNGKPRSFLY